MRSVLVAAALGAAALAGAVALAQPDALPGSFADDFDRGLCTGRCASSPWAIAQQVDGVVRAARAPGRAGLALLATAGPKRDGVSKADVVARLRPVEEGGRLRVAFDLRVPAGTPLNSLQLVDLECAACGEGGNPGVRLYLRRGRLRIDRSKIGIRDAWTRDDAPTLAHDRWHRIVWDLRVGGEGVGATRVRLDGVEVLAARGVTVAALPRRAVDRVQIGITATSNAVPATAWFDNIAVTVAR